jgi:hypothetical protein
MLFTARNTGGLSAEPAPQQPSGENGQGRADAGKKSRQLFFHRSFFSPLPIAVCTFGKTAS